MNPIPSIAFLVPSDRSNVSKEVRGAGAVDGFEVRMARGSTGGRVEASEAKTTLGSFSFFALGAGKSCSSSMYGSTSSSSTGGGGTLFAAGAEVATEEEEVPVEGVSSDGPDLLDRFRFRFFPSIVTALVEGAAPAMVRTAVALRRRG